MTYLEQRAQKRIPPFIRQRRRRGRLGRHGSASTARSRGRLTRMTCRLRLERIDESRGCRASWATQCGNFEDGWRTARLQRGRRESPAVWGDLLVSHRAMVLTYSLLADYQLRVSYGSPRLPDCGLTARERLAGLWEGVDGVVGGVGAGGAVLPRARMSGLTSGLDGAVCGEARASAPDDGVRGGGGIIASVFF